MNIGFDVLTISLNAYARVVPGALTPISSVQYTAKSENGSNVLTAGNLADDGNPPDTQRNDSLYSGRITFQIVRSTVGVLRVELIAEDAAGFKSNSVLLPLQIIRTNLPPVLSQVIAPDSLRLAVQDTTIKIRVTAKDTNGLADIKSVYFDSYLPSGSPSQSNPILLYDDGTHGDAAAADGVFTREVLFPSTASLGTYRFEFRALDNLNAASNVLIHRMTVVQ